MNDDGGISNKLIFTKIAIVKDNCYIYNYICGLNYTNL